MGTESRGGVTVAYFGDVYPTPSQGQREMREMMSWVNCGENPGSLPASSPKRVFLRGCCDVIGPTM